PADVLVGELARDLEFDWDEVVAAELARPSGGDERRDRGEVLLASEGDARRGEHLSGVARLSAHSGVSHQHTGREHQRQRPRDPRHQLPPRAIPSLDTQNGEIVRSQSDSAKSRNEVADEWRNWRIGELENWWIGELVNWWIGELVNW